MVATSSNDRQAIFSNGVIELALLLRVSTMSIVTDGSVSASPADAIQLRYPLAGNSMLMYDIPVALGDARTRAVAKARMDSTDGGGNRIAIAPFRSRERRSTDNDQGATAAHSAR